MADQSVPKDPIQTRSLSKPIFAASVILMGAFALAMWDEFIWRRPYKAYQEEFIAVYGNFLEHDLLPRQEAALAQLLKDHAKEYEAARAGYERHRANREQAEQPLIEQLEIVEDNLARINAAMKVPNAEFNAWKYTLEKATTEGNDAEREEAMREMERVQKGPYALALRQLPGGEEVTEDYDRPALNRLFKQWSDIKVDLQAQRARLTEQENLYLAQMEKIIDDNLVGPRPDAVRKRLQDVIDSRKVGPNDEPMGWHIGPLPNGRILQIHLGKEKDDWVDRCESCHVGTREPFRFTVEDLEKRLEADGVESDYVGAFSSHPNQELISLHDPENFGCSTCHNGNGRSVTSIELAHGLNKHWLWPLHPRENFEAGCVQCHSGDLELDHAPTLSKGKWLFYWKGCRGCHYYEGYDQQLVKLKEVEKDIHARKVRRDRLMIDRKLEKKQTAKQKIDLVVSGIDTELEQLEKEHAALEQEYQRVGPSLRNVKAKLKPGFITEWIKDPKKFRPSTKMPQFRLSEDQLRKIAAYVWQASDTAPPNAHAQGDAQNGRDLFYKRGCLGCHTIIDESSNEMVGDGFAADLTRIGDKANYDFIVEWIMNPTSGVMPNLRLTEEEARDITTYLFSRGEGTRWPEAPELENPNLAEEGIHLVRNFGCAGCHEIQGIAIEEARIGTELTVEGSKPKERLDFGRREHDFKRKKISRREILEEAGVLARTPGLAEAMADDDTPLAYNHKSFFEVKLAWPDFYDQDRYFEDPLTRSRMPNFRLRYDEITALTTFLMGSLESEIPQNMRYAPVGQKKAIQEGWWIVRKYNCVGCHQFEPGVEPKLWTMPQYEVGAEDELGRRKQDLRPPSLVGQGFRTDPEWLANFLRNPTLGDARYTHGNGVRTYLDIRMPTFRLSEREISKLVAFFGALSSQPEPYVPPVVEALDEQELGFARELFKNVQCVKCHAIGEPERDLRQANAPRLTLVGERLKSEWTSRWLEKPRVMMPGTQMPANFQVEKRVRLKDGTEYVGYEYLVLAATGQATMKLTANDQQVTFKDTDVAEIEDLRLIYPGQIPGYKGDHRTLLVRYLHRHYDDAEIPYGLPD